ncbi:general substrate transporter [Myriangium duriaei CBS 260.36]|uniref:General substrate transporter n=1 Tax=Myriangium duriaei CBS 260.36 TaxID=1168546 RepID=A0A9P4MER7_9PEZI|nr:general substrate transporter [Myriangium duriaei CBS 260.36]
MAMSPSTYQFLVGVFASLGSFLYGYDLGVIGGVVASASFKTTLNNPSSNEVGAVVSLFTGGAFFGAAFAGVTGDALGRRLTILLGAVIFCLGGGLQTGAHNISYFYAGRALAGLGVGFMVMIIPPYQAEISQSSIRGRITGLQQFMLGIGAAVAVWIDYGTNQHIANTNNNQWRVPLGIQIIPAGILALLILLFPESPRWLMEKGREQDALATLARLHAHGDQNNSLVVAEFEHIQAAIAHEHEAGARGYKDLFTDRSCFRRLILVTALQASVQMTGVSAIQYFSPEIYKGLNIGTTAALKYQGISNVLSILAQLCTILFIDYTGRRWTLIVGNLVNCAMFIIVTATNAVFLTASVSQQHALGWLFIVANWIYQISFSFTCGSLSWIIPAEIFDTKTRSKGVSIGVMISFAFNTMIGQITDPAINNIGWRYFLVFVVCNFTNAIFFWAFMPETKKRPLEEMNNLFANSPWFVPTMDSRAYAVRDFDPEIKVPTKKDSHAVRVESL